MVNNTIIVGLLKLVDYNYYIRCRICLSCAVRWLGLWEIFGDDHDGKELRKLSRRALLELLLLQSKEIDRLQTFLQQTQDKLNSRNI